MVISDNHFNNKKRESMLGKRIVDAETLTD